jgi:aminoglycoside 6'-N-acetyltransferase
MRDEQEEYERMARWRNQPHVREWWDPDEPPLSVEGARSEYGPDTQAGTPTVACVIEQDDQPVGFLQFYRWSAYADEAQTIGIPFDEDTWGLDVFVGEPARSGQGLGSAAVDLLCRHLFEQRGASAVALVAARDNARALRAYEKAGFRRGASVLDLDTRNGQRVESWLMVRRRES